MSRSKIAITTNGRLLLLKNDDCGKIALIGASCLNAANIMIRTDALQHPGCIDFALSSGRRFYSCDFDRNEYSKCYMINPYPGDFIVKLRWNSGHNPYPEIKNMEVWVFGVYLGDYGYPKAPDDYLHIAYVSITSDGKIFVNGYDTTRTVEY